MVGDGSVRELERMRRMLRGQLLRRREHRTAAMPRGPVPRKPERLGGLVLASMRCGGLVLIMTFVPEAFSAPENSCTKQLCESSSARTFAAGNQALRPLRMLTNFQRSAQSQHSSLL